jgi:hypothetical protein
VILSEAARTKQGFIDMLGILIEEFNCNHQADIFDAESRVEIFTRDREQKLIKTFIQDNMSK